MRGNAVCHVLLAEVSNHAVYRLGMRAAIEKEIAVNVLSLLQTKYQGDTRAG